MSDRSDGLLKRLSEIDPTREDPGPAEGSRRYQSILEAAMRTAQDSGTIAPTDRSPAPSRWRRRLAFAVAAAVVVAAVTVTIVLIQPQHGLTPEAAVAAAAMKLGDATTLRGTMVMQTSLMDEDYSFHKTLQTATFAVEGANHQVTVKTEEEGQAPNTYSFTVIGDQRWDTLSDSTTIGVTLNANMRRAPFAAASKALLEAALTDASVVNVGSEVVRGRPATHYHLQSAESGHNPVAQLPDSVLAWFELRDVKSENVRVSFDVWVSDGAIVRMTVDEALHAADLPIKGGKTVHLPEIPATMTTEFYDYGADIHIEPPAGSKAALSSPGQ